MGRRSHTQTLSIWANGQRVGTWSVDGRGLHALRFDPGLSPSLVASIFEGLRASADALRQQPPD
jgi:hypothetical protein